MGDPFPWEAEEELACFRFAARLCRVEAASMVCSAEPAFHRNTEAGVDPAMPWVGLPVVVDHTPVAVVPIGEQEVGVGRIAVGVVPEDLDLAMPWVGLPVVGRTRVAADQKVLAHRRVPVVRAGEEEAGRIPVGAVPGAPVPAWVGEEVVRRDRAPEEPGRIVDDREVPCWDVPPPSEVLREVPGLPVLRVRHWDSSRNS